MDLSTWWNRLYRKATSLLSSSSLESGLYTYPIDLNGGSRRIHLRVEDNDRGAPTGVLFIDVTDVIHLNATAVHMVKLALDGVGRDEARARILRAYRDVKAADLEPALARMYNLVDQLRSSEGCPTCALAPDLSFEPVFSTPVTAPYKADVALTYACNNACPHCYNEPDRFTMATLDREGWFRVLDILAEVGVPHIILTGGEPTLHPDLLDLVRHAEDLGQIVGMNTNGRRLARGGLAVALAKAGLNHVQVTLESPYAEVHNAMVNADAFQETVEGIRNALAAGIHTITNTTLTRQNQDHALETVRFVHELGLRTFAMNGIIYAGGGAATPDAIPAEEMAAVLAAVRDQAAALDMRFLWYTVTDYCRLSPVALGLSPKRCNAAEYSICIEPNADVLPCQSYYVSAGNLLADPWDAIWNSDLFLSFRNRENDPLAAGLPETCWDCPDLEMCGGGCRLERETHAGLRPAERGCARARQRVRQQAREATDAVAPERSTT